MISFSISRLLSAIILASCAIALPQSFCPAKHGADGVSVRVPPVFGNAWTSPPAGWDFKPWNMIYTSNPANLALRNFQYDPSPVDPKNLTGQVNDLSSFQIPNNSTVFTSYGVDTPDPELDEVLDYAGTGILEGASSEYTMLAWGCDAAGVPYYSTYSTATALTKTPAAIDVMSTSEVGPDQATVLALVDALKAAGNQEIADLTAALRKTVQDGGRDGLPRVTQCDDYCKSNEDLKAILG